jgi:hypothetical protein
VPPYWGLSDGVVTAVVVVVGGGFEVVVLVVVVVDVPPHAVRMNAVVSRQASANHMALFFDFSSFPPVPVANRYLYP